MRCSPWQIKSQKSMVVFYSVLTIFILFMVHEKLLADHREKPQTYSTSPLRRVSKKTQSKEITNVSLKNENIASQTSTASLNERSHSTPAVNTTEQLYEDQMRNIRSKYTLEETYPVISGNSQDKRLVIPCLNDCLNAQTLMKTWNASKPRAAIYYLARPDSMTKLMKSLYRLFEFFNNKYHYPIIIFHESDFTPSIQKVKSAGYPSIFFELVKFEMPSFIKHHVPELIHKKDVGYRHMCRFHARMVYFHSITRLFDYILRLDDDSYLHHVPYDIFEFMDDHSLEYGYVNIMTEPKAIEGLWESVEVYVNTTKLPTQFYGEWRKDLMYYNNFELSKTSLWISDDYMNYVDFIDRLGGIFYHRWGDAPIKSIGVSLFVPKNRTHNFNELGYRHQKFVQN